jgi:hypothetical protein
MQIKKKDLNSRDQYTAPSQSLLASSLRDLQNPSTVVSSRKDSRLEQLQKLFAVDPLPDQEENPDEIWVPVTRRAGASAKDLCDVLRKIQFLPKYLWAGSKGCVYLSWSLPKVLLCVSADGGFILTDSSASVFDSFYLEELTPRLLLIKQTENKLG